MRNETAWIVGLASLIGLVGLSIFWINRLIWKDEEPAIVPSNTFRYVHPAQFWDEGKVYVTVNWWHSNETLAWEFRLTNTLDEVMAWMQPRSDSPLFWLEINGTNAIELKGIVP